MLMLTVSLTAWPTWSEPKEVTGRLEDSVGQRRQHVHCAMVDHAYCSKDGSERRARRPDVFAASPATPKDPFLADSVLFLFQFAH